MRIRSRAVWLTTLGVTLVVSACDTVARARERFASPDSLTAVAPDRGLMLGLQTPGALRPGEEGILRVSVTNQGDSVASDIRVELIVPDWIEPLPPRLGDREMSMAPLEDGSIRFAYRLSEAPLPPGGAETIQQRVRVASSGPIAEGASAWSRVIRARLIGDDAQPVAEVRSELALVGTDGTDTVAHAAAGVEGRSRLGPARLGMSAGELRAAAPGARDTSWSREGTTERGILVPLGSGRTALAVLTGDSVGRLEVGDRGVRTREGFGAGSTLRELRTAYGPACADAAEGRVVVWFPRAPGLSFQLDVEPPGAVATVRENPSTLPADARVTRWWLRKGSDRCPR